MSSKAKRVLLSIDDIMDTRLGFIKLVNESLFKSFLSEEIKEYILRYNDKVLYERLGWDRETWRQAWAQRNIDVVKNSVVNRVPDIVNNIMIEYMTSNEEAIGSTSFTLEINLYPYHFDEEEKEALHEVMEEFFPAAKDIEFVQIDIDRLTPAMIKSNYFLVGIYDFYEWSGKHGLELRKIFMPQSTILSPRFFAETIIDRKLTREERQVFEMDPFKLIETVLGFKFRMMFVPASDYAPIFIPPVKKQVETQDLDSPVDQSVLYTHESSLYDHLSQFLPESELSSAAQARGQASPSDSAE